MVEHKVIFYENLSPVIMQNCNTKNPFINSMHTLSPDELSHSRVRRLISDFTEIKRPSGRFYKQNHHQHHHRTTDVSPKPLLLTRKAAIKYNTLPRSSSKGSSRNESRTGHASMRSPRKYEANGYRPQRDHVKTSNSSSKHDDNEKWVVVSYNNDQQESIIEMDHLKLNPPSPPVISKHNHDENNNSSKLENESTESESNQISEIPELILNTEIDFGLNTFDESDGDNYVLEAYNDPGNELMTISFEVNRKSFSKKEDEDNSDVVVHQNVTDNSLQIVKYLDSDSNSNCEKSEDSNDDSLEVNGNDTRLSTANTIDSGLGDMINSRSTLYSTSSSSSSLSSGGTETGDNETETETEHHYENVKVVRHEKIRDDAGNVRISKMYSAQDLSKINNAEIKFRNKLSYIIEELIETEQRYITGLEKVVLQYKPYVQKNEPNFLLGKSTYIFGNIEKIYEEAKNFMMLLKQKPDVDGVVNAIIISASMFKLYPKYSKNKPKADRLLKEFEPIIREREKELGDRLDLASYLLTPIQRLGKYILMLDNIEKELRKMNKVQPNVHFALQLIKTEMKKGNDSIAIDSIKSCPINLIMHGSFMMREKFTVLKPKKFESMVFLFEQIVVFTQSSQKNLEEFIYVDSIRMDDLSIAPLETEPQIFHLWNYSKVKKGSSEKYTFVIEAKNEKIKRLWTEMIEKRLWEQLERVKKQQTEFHCEQGKRFSKLSLSSSVADRKKSQHQPLERKVSMSKFYDVG